MRQSDSTPLASPTYGFLPVLLEWQFLQEAQNGGTVFIESLQKPYQNGQLWCGVWRFYVKKSDGSLFVLATSKGGHPRDLKTINGVLSMAARLGVSEIQLPLAPAEAQLKTSDSTE